jgi:hypothetical protein
LSQVEVGAGFQAGLAVVILAIFLDRVTAALGERAAPAKKLERRLRAAKRRAARTSGTAKAGEARVGADA